jgi:hypothetical protein
MNFIYYLLSKFWLIQVFFGGLGTHGTLLCGLLWLRFLLPGKFARPSRYLNQCEQNEKANCDCREFGPCPPLLAKPTPCTRSQCRKETRPGKNISELVGGKLGAHVNHEREHKNKQHGPAGKGFSKRLI